MRAGANHIIDAYRPPYLAAAIAGVAVWLLYALTLAPTTWFWDTSEYITTAHILGVPHPPGNPLFVLLARAWDVMLTPFPISTAVRINLFSATMSALAHVCWFLLAHRIMSFFSADRWFRLIGAGLAVAVSATAFTVWNQSNVNEKVYTVSLFTIALLSWLAFRWRDNLGRGKDDNLLILMVFILALSVGNHLMAFLAAPALLVFILLVDPATLKNWRLYAFAALAVLVGVSVHLYLPLRAGLSPVINEAAPTCPSIGSALQSIVTFGRSGCENLSDALARRQYMKPSAFSNPLPGFEGMPRPGGLFLAQIANYIQYFDWQWARSIAGNRDFLGGWRPLITLIFTIIGVYGAFSHYLRDKKSFAYVAVLFLTLSFGLTFYLNFKYGYNYPGANINFEMREVRERDYFFIVSFSLWGVWIGIGLAALWQRVSDAIGRDQQAAAVTRSPAQATGVLRPRVQAAFVLIPALLPLLLNWSWANRSRDWSARDWAYNLLMSVEPYGVLFTNGDNDTFPLWYVQEVEGLRRDVTVIVMSYLNTSWYVKQLRQLTTPCQPGQDPESDSTRIICQRPFKPAGAPRVYESYRPPTRSIIPLTDAQIEQVARTAPFLLGTPQVFRASNIETTIPGEEAMIPADLFMGYIVTTALKDRPVYFASTTQAFRELRLDPYMLRQGVAFKLHDGPIRADTVGNIIAMPKDYASVGAFLDFQRTQFLVANTFVHRSGFPNEWDNWVDSATQQIPFYYAYTHALLAHASAVRGDTTAMVRHTQAFDRFRRLGMQ